MKLKINKQTILMTGGIIFYTVWFFAKPALVALDGDMMVLLQIALLFIPTLTVVYAVSWLGTATSRYTIDKLFISVLLIIALSVCTTYTAPFAIIFALMMDTTLAEILGSIVIPSIALVIFSVLYIKDGVITT